MYLDIQARLSVEVPPAVCEDCYKRALKEFTKISKVCVYIVCSSIFQVHYYDIFLNGIWGDKLHWETSWQSFDFGNYILRD